MLTGSLFMLQVYDRVLPSPSVPTLVPPGALAAALLDTTRATSLVFIGNFINSSQQGTPDRCLNSCRSASFVDDVVDMKVDGALGHVHQDRDISRRFSFRYPRYGLDLAIRQDEGRRRRSWAMTQAASYDLDQELEIQRLGQEIIASESPGAQVAVTTAVRGNEEEGNLAQFASRSAQQPENIESRHAGHIHITQDEIRALADFLHALVAVECDDGLQPFILQYFGQKLAGRGIILDAEDFGTNVHATTRSEARGSSMVTFVP